MHTSNLLSRRSPFALAFVVFLWFLFAMILSVDKAYGQSETDSMAVGTLIVVHTDDGNEYVGRFIEQDERVVRVATEQLGELTLFRSTIKRIRTIKEERIQNGEYWAENLQSTRYFWGPSGHGLKPGEKYYQNVMLFFNQLVFGVTDHASIGFGVVPTFLFEGAPTPIWVTPKLSMPLGGSDSNIRLGVGGLIGTVAGGEVDNSGFGLAYGVLTFGSVDRNISFGLGKGYADGEWGDNATLSISAMARVGKRGYVVTENYIFDLGNEYGSSGLVSLGGRVVGKRLSFDFGLMAPVEEGEVYYALPWIGVTVPMGV